MADLGPLDGDVEELDGRGLCAIPGLVDCHTHACFAGDRVEEFALRAAGASYEELHAAGGGILSTVRATRAAGEEGLTRPSSGTRLDARARARPPSRPSPATGSTATRSSRSCGRYVPAGGIPTWLGAHAVPPEFHDADAYLDFALAEVLPEAAKLAEAADVFLERGAFDADAGAPLPDRLPRGRARPPAPRRPVHRAGSDPARGRARRALGRPPGGDRPRRHRGTRRERGHRRCCSPRARSSSAGRCRLRATLVDAGAAGRARDRLQPRQRVLREPAARLLARRDAAEALPGRGAGRDAPSTPPTCSAARSARGASRPATTPTSCCSTRPTGGTSPTTSATTSRRGRRRWAELP